MKGVLIRSLSGLVYMALIILPVVLRDPALFVTVFSVFIILGLREFAQLVNLNRTRPLRTFMDGLFGAFLFAAIFLYGTGRMDATIFAPYLFYVLYTMVRSLYSDRHKAGSDNSRTFMGHLYIAATLGLGSLLLDPAGIGRQLVEGRQPDFMPHFFLFVFVLIWLNDTGAFIAGSLFGKHTLFKVISPKKTWEGFFGGLAFTIAGTFVAAHLYGSTKQPMELVFFALIVTSMATWGDLYESNLKRNAGVKDSGRIIPGHGGVLDRLDSAFFVFPAVYLYALVAGLS
ncbi:phosphatidate cytidylyltransferase [Porphyromonas loveana]|uniref:phosphatidate cytidylyltransferase n=1 Tax=Porphyromonas loveana TaxID=1884669 RepID=UPI0035A0901A